MYFSRAYSENELRGLRSPDMAVDAAATEFRAVLAQAFKERGVTWE